MSLSQLTRLILGGVQRPVRDDIVGAQYENTSAAAGYAAAYELPTSVGSWPRG